MFLIDASGMLLCMGVIDDRPSASHASVKGAQRPARAVGRDAGRPIALGSTRPYGCTIKY